MKMVDIVKVLDNKVQVFPQTHADAVIGLSSVQGPKGDTGATGPQGPTGQNATTTNVATTTVNGLMAATDKVKLNGLASITFEKVGEV